MPSTLVAHLHEAILISPHFTTLNLVLLCLLVFLLAFLVKTFLYKRGKARQVPSLPETVPFFSNSLQYLRDLPSFCRRAAKALQQTNMGVVTFRFLGKPAFVVSGGKNAQALFRTSAGLTSEYFVLLLVGAMWDPTKEDLARFAADRSGRLKNPAPGWEHMPTKDRLWSVWHHIGTEYLTKARPTNDLVSIYARLFTEKLSRLPLNQWVELQVFDLLRRDMTESAAISLTGRRILEMNPGFFDVMRELEAYVLPIAFGVPRWLNPKAYKVRDRWRAMNMKFMAEALRTFDWEGPESKAEWGETFGSAFGREIVRWMVNAGMSLQTTAGIFGVQILNQNTSTVPAAAWAVMDVLKAGPGLVSRIREEAETALIVDPQTGERRFDTQKLVTLPLLQGVFVEALRLHVNFNIIREATRDTTLDTYDVPKGALVQAPTLIAHYDRIWDSDGHPPTEFWPDRHLKQVWATDEQGNTVARYEFSMGNRNPYWFPFGGGVSMCAGKHYAKQEIVITVATLTTMFDIEFVEWTTLDGSPSDREARDSDGFVTMLPDRDMKVRLRRRW